MPAAVLAAYARIVRRLLVSLGAIAAVVFTFVGPADATWSIVGVDPETGEVGVAIASCVPISQLGDLEEPLFLVALVPGVGAGVTQAQVNPSAPQRMETLLGVGQTAIDVIDDVSSEEFDAQFEVRQHGVVTLAGSAAGDEVDSAASYTGVLTDSFTGDRQGSQVAVQGNLLANGEVLDATFEAFEAAAGAPLAERLVEALAAGSEAGGDGRCDETAFFAHLVVVEPGDVREDPSVLMTFGSMEPGDNPVLALEAAFAEGTRQEIVVPDDSGFGSIVAWIGLVACAFLIGSGVVFWRRAYR